MTSSLLQNRLITSPESALAQPNMRPHGNELFDLRSLQSGRLDSIRLGCFCAGEESIPAREPVSHIVSFRSLA
jgi:hypothetical protein